MEYLQSIDCDQLDERRKLKFELSRALRMDSLLFIMIEIYLLPMARIKVEKSNEEWKLPREEFRKRFQQNFLGPYFKPHQEKIDQLEEVAWDNYLNSRKAPLTSKAGTGHSDSSYELSDEWIKTKQAIVEAQKEYENPITKSRVLIVCGSDRNDHTCPGEISKSYRLMKHAEETLNKLNLDVETLNLSKMTSEYGKIIFPCKGCVSTAMPLCHWPCSCYPNHSLNQVNDWMNEIYPMWLRAHGIMIISPVYWHGPPSALKLMIDRLVCADGGNPDPTTTQGKDSELAKKLELEGWEYPRHLKGRIFSIIVHGDAQGVDELKNALSSWLSEMMLVPTGTMGHLSRYIGYYESYAESHKALTKDQALWDELTNSCQSLALSIEAKRAHKLESFTPDLNDPRPK